MHSVKPVLGSGWIILVVLGSHFGSSDQGFLHVRNHSEQLKMREDAVGAAPTIERRRSKNTAYKLKQSWTNDSSEKWCGANLRQPKLLHSVQHIIALWISLEEDDSDKHDGDEEFWVILDDKLQEQ